MKNVFLVKTEQGAIVVTENSLSLAIKAKLEENTKVKLSDIKEFVKKVMADYAGDSITNAEYEACLDNFAGALEDFSKMTAYDLYKQQMKVLTN
jgi:translation initiation factor 2 gamma subunit (eIF-2gamma)